MGEGSELEEAREGGEIGPVPTGSSLLRAESVNDGKRSNGDSGVDSVVDDRGHKVQLSAESNQCIADGDGARTKGDCSTEVGKERLSGCSMGR